MDILYPVKRRKCSSFFSSRISPKQTIRVFAKKLVVEEVENESDEISLEDAQQISKRYAVGDFVEFDY